MRKIFCHTTHKLLLLITVGSLYAFASRAQYVTDYKKNGDNFYRKGDYYSAALYYEKYLSGKVGKGNTYEPYTVLKKGASGTTKGSSTHEQIVYRIAESYRLLNDYAKAEEWYSKAITFDKASYPYTKYWYGVTLRANGKYAEAQNQQEDFLKGYKESDTYATSAKREIADLIFIQEQLKKKDVTLYTVKKLDTAINVQGANYAPSWNDNKLVFTSTRIDSSLLSDKKKNPHINNLYQVSTGMVERSGIPAAPEVEQGTASFTADGNTVYFTRWTKKEGKNLSAIYNSERKNGQWQEPVKLSNNINIDGYSSEQPFVTTDGKYLLFASDRPGGTGKFDIWYAPLTGGQAGTAVNMGNTINTAEDEEAPYYHQLSNTLVYASNGLVGMGGFDLFQSTGIVAGSFTAPKNLGYPVNSIKDDIYFLNKGNKQLLKDVYLSSDRASACCLELFSLDKQYKKFMTGIVIDCKTNQPLTGTDIHVIDSVSNKTILLSQVTGGDGKYLFETENSLHVLKITGNKADYTDASLYTAPPAASDADTLYNIVLCLVPVEKSTPVTETPAAEKAEQQLLTHFAFDKYVVETTSRPLLDSLVALLQREKSLGLEIGGYTDDKGTVEYNLKLSEERANACKEYLVKAGIDAARLKAKAYGKCCSVQPDTLANGQDNPDGRAQNRRVEFKILYLK
ncbi:OmpA/MotB domain-containing protein [Russula earlei]|uniref:OmpA/MotB domain-containing protein n=1 Tax=Russula earlei TaxID=71964 RepID=A0ACC0TVE4_9AGAM|nr:OmpA/MotB domain-containing protein [Russula earlei]